MQISLAVHARILVCLIAVLIAAPGAFARELCPFLLDPANQEAVLVAFREIGKANRGRNNAYRTDALPQIDIREVEDTVQLKGQPGYGGGNNSGLMRGMLDGREVFVKLCNLREGVTNGLSEASYAKLMSDFHLGPHFTA